MNGYENAADAATSYIKSGTAFTSYTVVPAPAPAVAPPPPAAAAATVAAGNIAAEPNVAAVAPVPNLAADFGLDHQQIGQGNGIDLHNNKLDAIQFDNFVTAQLPNAAADVGDLLVVGAELFPGGGIGVMLAKAHNDPAYAASLTLSTVITTIVTDALAAGKAAEVASQLRKIGGSLKGSAGEVAKIEGAISAAESELTRAVYTAEDIAKRAAEEAAGGLGRLSRASEFGIQPYNQLAKEISGTGLQAHHLIEKRFAKILGMNSRAMEAIALTPAEHQAFTNLWRKAIPYGSQSVSRERIMDAARKVYADFPDILRVLVPYQIQELGLI